MLFSDKLFYFFQAFFINWEFAIFDHIRPMIYRPFFRRLGSGTKISPGTHFKYPSEITIGDKVYIGRNCLIVGKGGLTIGNDLLMGSGSKICTTAHIYENSSIPINRQGLRYQSISIGNNVWIGFDCKILGGVIVKSNAILAANSVLLEEQYYEENSLIAGIPAVKKGVMYA